jgi:hypothetical protein
VSERSGTVSSMSPAQTVFAGEGGRRGGRVGEVMANQIARRLRKQMTPQEVKLWVHLRSWRKQGYHFRRQAPRDGYVVDFAFLKQRLDDLISTSPRP